MADDCLVTHLLPNGLRLELFNLSRHYFGGYWRVELEARCMVPLAAGCCNDSAQFEEQRRLLGDSVPFVRRLERMAVPAEAVDAVRAELLARIERQMLPLLSHEQFAPRFITGEYTKRLKRPVRGIPCHS